MNILFNSANSTNRWLSNIRLLFIIVLIFVALGLSAEGSTSAGVSMGSMKNRYGYAQVNADDLMHAMPMKDFTLINVHIPYGGEIPGTDANIPYNQINEITAMYPDKGETLVVYCRSGSMSALASKELANLGYTSIIELKGGYNAWGRAGGEMMNR